MEYRNKATPAVRKATPLKLIGLIHFFAFMP